MIPIPQAAYDVIQDLLKLSKQAAVSAQAHEKRANDLDQELRRVKAATPAPAPASFDRKLVDGWVEQLKAAGFVLPDDSHEKVAKLILTRPQDLISMLIQAQLPPEAQGHPLTKEASAEKSDKPVLVDHDGWSDCLRPGV